MHSAPTEPLGLQLIGTVQQISAALDSALIAAGGSRATWLVLVAASGKDHNRQSHGEMYDGNSDDLHRMLADGLITFGPDRHNPAAHSPQLTEPGRELFHRLLRAVVAFDKQLRTGLTDAEISVLGDTLRRLRGNVAKSPVS